MTTTDAIVEALRSVADPCCRERGISVVDMGLLHDINVEGRDARVDILLTSGWCPFQLDLVESISEAVEAVPGVARASVRIVLDDVWSTQRMSDDARRKLRFLPEPSEVADRHDYIAAHSLPLAPPAAGGKATP